ncbi:hypothetical protein K431DRAFT_269474 [Polychaeton citri CBS 116435]|uniref:Phosphoglycerate mutase-like protein n=1 Tax=Polychaeton citri CBS 116435 TaxID=1314669 RepID=A0A9P4Q9T9_9PEZI|nr:hypothetical protein K431DRAFT_269474 [Polychaeton citri CBS 116435]
MGPVLHIMRHAQGFHDTLPEGHQIHDPHLTPHGVEECKAVLASFKTYDRIDLLLASPMRRAIQTCRLCFAPCVEQRGMKIIALPLAEEATADPSDTGSSIDVLRSEFGDFVDLTNVKDGWYQHIGEFATDHEHLVARATHLRQWIRNRPEREAVLVCHGLFAHYITGEVDEKGNQTTGWWKDAELRTYRFTDGADEMALLSQVKAEALSMS